MIKTGPYINSLPPGQHRHNYYTRMWPSQANTRLSNDLPRSGFYDPFSQKEKMARWCLHHLFL